MKPSRRFNFGPDRSGKTVERRPFRTIRAAVSFFRDARAQGYSPSLLASGGGFEVCVWSVR